MPSLPPEAWRNNTAWLRGVDLYNARYFWEAHEIWEALWHAEGRRGDLAQMLKAFIQVAAAHLKCEEKRGRVAELLWKRALASLEEIATRHRPRFMGCDLESFVTSARSYFLEDSSAFPVLVLEGEPA